jgi:hypothetical protein
MSLLYSRCWVMTSRNALEGARQCFAMVLARRDIPSPLMADRVKSFMRGAFERLPSMEHLPSAMWSTHRKMGLAAS